MKLVRTIYNIEYFIKKKAKNINFKGAPIRQMLCLKSKTFDRLDKIACFNFKSRKLTSYSDWTAFAVKI